MERRMENGWYVAKLLVHVNDGVPVLNERIKAYLFRNKGSSSSVENIYCSIIQFCFAVFFQWGKGNLT